MKPVLMRSKTDCLPACIASLLEIPPQLIPNYATLDGDGQTEATQRWLKKLGYTLVDTVVEYKGGKLALPMTPAAVPVYAIACVRVKVHGWGHAVVVRVHKNRIQWIHDPEPVGGKRSSYGRYLRLGFLVPLDPKVSIA